MKFEGNRKAKARKEKTRTALERGRCPVSNLLNNTLRERRLRLGAPLRSASTLIALIKWSGSCRTDRSTSHWKTKPTSKQEEEALQRKLQPRSTNLMN